MTIRRPLPVLLLTAALALALTGFVLPDQLSAPTSAPTIHPGVQTDTAGGACTANFVFTDGDDLYLGQAAHCAGTGAATSVNGCEAGSLPIGTPVDIEGASQPGTLVYSSWLAMQAVDEDDINACQFNDFALVEVAEADEVRVSPTIPFGGPTGIDTDGTEPGETVYTYGDSPLRQGLLPARSGTTSGTVGDGWSHVALFPATPGIPGDSGSPVVNEDGAALGVLVTLGVAPSPATNGVTDLQRALSYANAHVAESQLDGPVSLVDGNEPFTAPGLLGDGDGLLEDLLGGDGLLGDLLGGDGPLGDL